VKNQCLTEVLNGLNADCVQSIAAAQHIDFDEKSCDVLASASKEEIAFYIQTDPVFASLYKRYRQAKTQFNQFDPSCDDQAAMMDIAEWKLESAEGACLTRLIEMQNEEETQRALQLYKEEKAAEIEDAVKLRVTRRRKDFRKHRLLTMTQKNKALRDGSRGYFFIMMLVSMLQEMVDVTTDNLSLAFAFEHASLQPSYIPVRDTV
jgi:hypothetical protein